MRTFAALGLSLTCTGDLGAFEALGCRFACLYRILHLDFVYAVVYTHDMFVRRPPITHNGKYSQKLNWLRIDSESAIGLSSGISHFGEPCRRTVHVHV
jgi:hypothetical protein